MALTAGTRLGPYEILSALGTGGMGEVYLARDTRLARDVAIKVLPPHLASTPEARARFEREARAVSSLNHPHICTLHDVGREGDTDFIVMERLEGETLAARLARGPLPVEEALRLGVQIADALDRAHRSGLVHRDLKPGNVMLTRSGAKLLDFGLARPVQEGGGEAGSLTMAPTITTPLTAEGTIVGTFQYMAPEQLEGKEADARSDLWALGALLYEAVTGQRAFAGKSQASLIAAILERQPQPLAATAPLAPPALERLIQACLAKDPEERVQTAHDVKLQLQWILEGGSQAGVPVPVAARRRSRERLAWAIASVAALAAVGLGAWLLLRPVPKPTVTRFLVRTPQGQSSMSWPRISPDGRTLAFVASDTTGVQRIWLRPLDAVQALPLPGTEGAGRPFWSPDGKHLAFVADGKLKKVPASGGPAVLIADTPGRWDGSWGADDVILLDGGAGDTLMAVPAGGGLPRPASSLDRAHFENQNAWPFFLPDGKHFLFIADRSDPQDRRSHIKLGELGSMRSTDLGSCDSRVEFAPPDRVVYAIEGTLVAQRLDLGKRRLVGEPVPLTDQVVGQNSGLFSVSPGNVLVVGTGSEGGMDELEWLDRTGHRLGRAAVPNRYNDVALAPDGHRAAASIIDTRTSNNDIWVLDLERNVTSRLTFDPGDEAWPRWSPDGTRILYTADRAGPYRMYVKAASGVGADDSLVASTGEDEGGTDWSRDGAWIASAVISGRTSWDVWVRPATGGGAPRAFLATPRAEGAATFSPDGRWIAYGSNETGRTEIYVRSFPSGEGKWQISSGGGSHPKWTKGGRELVYQAPGPRFMAVPITSGDGFRAGTPKLLFERTLASTSVLRNSWDVTQDGERFLLVAPLGRSSQIVFTVTQNWLETLPKKK